MHDSIQCRERALHLVKKRCQKSPDLQIETVLNGNWFEWVNSPKAKAGEAGGGAGFWLGFSLYWAPLAVMPMGPYRIFHWLYSLPFLLLSPLVSCLCERTKLKKIKANDTILDVCRRMQVKYDYYGEDEDEEPAEKEEPPRPKRWDDPPSAYKPKATSAKQKFENYSKKTRRREDFEEWIISAGGFARNMVKKNDPIKINMDTPHGELNVEPRSPSKAV